MIALLYPRRLFLALVLSGLTAGVFAQAPAAKDEFKPEVGQEGKDVVWVPTSQSLVNRMLDLAKLTPRDFLMDLGSGDGRTVITAAKRGARAVGVEYNPNMVELSRRNAVKEGMTERAQFIHGDIFETDFSKATVITLFLLPDLNVKLRPKILDMKPGTRVVSNSFTMGDWKSDETATATDDCTSYCTAYLWIVPAKVAGTWRMPQGEITLKQEFQMLTGTLKMGGNSSVITKGRVNADQLTFTAGGVEYTGRVSGNAIEASSKSGGKWVATR